jgi:pimeloyl-ACP methyl ester carboxylesterase
MDRQVIINNLLVSFSEIKGVNNKTLLFLHGWRSNKEVWDSVIKNLEPQGFSILAIDLPGFGLSQAPISAFNVLDYANIVAAFIVKLKLDNVVLVGHSFGGRVAIKVASKYSGLVANLVLVDSAGFATDDLKKNIFAVAAKIVKPLFKPKFMQPVRTKIYQRIGAEDYVATPNLQKTFVEVSGEDLSRDMQTVTCPTLVIFGDEDKDTPLEFGQKMNSLIPNSKLIIIPSASHFSFLDQPEIFVKSLCNFIL